MSEQKAVSLTGADTCKIGNRILSDVADGDWANLTFPNDLTEVKTGKNGNSIYAFNETGRQVQLELRLLRGSPDDKWMMNLLNNMKKDFSAFVLLNGEFIKRVGDGQGNITNDTYLVTGGVFGKMVEAKTSAEGDTEQSVSLYTLKFSNGERTLG